MDIKEFKEAAERVTAHRVKYPHGDGQYCAECRTDCVTIAAQAPMLLGEIERLTRTMSGHRGLDLARIEAANKGGNQDPNDVADLCDAVRRQSNEIERLTAENARLRGVIGDYVRQAAEAGARWGEAAKRADAKIEKLRDELQEFVGPVSE